MILSSLIRVACLNPWVCLSPQLLQVIIAAESLQKIVKKEWLRPSLVGLLETVGKRRLSQFEGATGAHYEFLRVL